MNSTSASSPGCPSSKMFRLCTNNTSNPLSQVKPSVHGLLHSPLLPRVPLPFTHVRKFSLSNSIAQATALSAWNICEQPLCSLHSQLLHSSLSAPVLTPDPPSLPPCSGAQVQHEQQQHSVRHFQLRQGAARRLGLQGRPGICVKAAGCP